MPPEFDIQMARITGTFGEGRVYSRERLALIWKAVNDLSAHSFSRIVDHFISNARYAPLPKDFQEAAYAERKNEFKRDVDGAAAAMDTPWSGGLQQFLGREYPGSKTLSQAVDIQILRNQIAKAKGTP